MKYLLFLIPLCFLWSCKTETAKEIITPTGNKFTLHGTSSKGPKPTTGEEVEFLVDIRIDTAILQTSRNSPVAAKFIIPEDLSGAAVSPLLEALTMMCVGDSATIKRSLDSFPQRPPGFETSEYVSYDVVLKSIRSKEDVAADQAAAQAKMVEEQARETAVAAQTNEILGKYTAKSLGADLKSTESGLKYYVIEEGTGKQVEPGGFADVHYYGITTDGNMFDNSFSRGTPYPVPVGRGQVIRGWDEGLALFKEGTKAVLFIPGELGYGAQGSPPNIGPNAELVFYVEISNVE